MVTATGARYACRAACPLCYCTRCIVEDNRPQWILPWASTLPNIEWQINRVMHMAGRCTGCTECERACPMDIPVEKTPNSVECIRCGKCRSACPHGAIQLKNGGRKKCS